MLLTYTLTFQFARSVTWTNDQQVPQEMEVVVIPLANPSFPDQGTYVGGLQSQKVTLTDATNNVAFNLVPSFAAGLSEPVKYRAEWRQGGVTGRTFSQEFAMPSQNATFDQLADLGQLVTGTDYIQQTQIGVANGIAALNAQGLVVDADGTPVAAQSDITTVSGLVTAEVINRQNAINALSTTFSTSLAEDINGLATTVATNLTDATSTLNATITSNYDDLHSRITTEASTRAASDVTLTTHYNTLSASVTTLGNNLSNKADLVGGYLSLAQVPPSIILTAYYVSGQSGMLNLSASAANGGQPPVHYADIAIWPTGAVWMLLGDPANPAPGTLANWQDLTSVVSVNGQQGNVTLTAANVNAVGINGASGSVTMGQVTGLGTAIAALATSADLSTLNTTVQGILNNTNIVYLDTSGASSGHINHAKLDSSVAYINNLNQVTLKDGTVVASGTGTVLTINGDSGPNVTLTAADVGAIATGASIAESQVTGLTADLAARILSSDTRLTNARTPTAHASTHAAAGSDPLSLAVTQITGLSTTLAGLAASSDLTNATARISTLESNVTFLLGGGTPSSSPIKANWYDGPSTFTGITNLPDFQNVYNVQLKGPFGKAASDGTFYYNPAGANSGEWQYAYITPNGHLQLRTWNEAGPADIVYATAAALAATNATITTLATIASLATLQTQVNAKANQSDLTATNTTMATLATQASVNALATQVGNAATQATVNALQTQVNTKASQTSVDSLAIGVASAATASSVTTLAGTVTATSTALNTKADLVSGTVPLNQLPVFQFSQISGLTTALAAKADLSSGTVPLAQLPSFPTSKVTNLDTALSNKADLVGGQVPSSQLPSFSINNVYTATNRAGMLALSGANVGDVCIITATADQGSYILATAAPATFTSWVLLVNPQAPVTSVNNQTGAVNLTASNVGAMAIGAAIPISQVTSLATTIAGLATTAALATAVTGLQSLAQVQGALSSSGIVKQVANYVATSAIASLAGQQSVDGVLTPFGSTVLATAQPSSVNNGLWVVNSGAWTRASDFATGSYLVRGTLVLVVAGQNQANTFWQNTATSGIVDTNATTWIRAMTAGGPIVYTAGNGITNTSNVLSANPVTGGGITVTTAGIAVDTSIVTRKFSASSGSTGFTAGSTIATVTHGLNTTDIGSVFIKEVSSGNQVLACPTITGPNTLTIEFAAAPATNQWRVTVLA